MKNKVSSMPSSLECSPSEVKYKKSCWPVKDLVRYSRMGRKKNKKRVPPSTWKLKERLSPDDAKKLENVILFQKEQRDREFANNRLQLLMILLGVFVIWPLAYTCLLVFWPTIHHHHHLPVAWWMAFGVLMIPNLLVWYVAIYEWYNRMKRSRKLNRMIMDPYFYFLAFFLVISCINISAPWIIMSNYTQRYVRLTKTLLVASSLLLIPFFFWWVARSGL